MPRSQVGRSHVIEEDERPDETATHRGERSPNGEASEVARASSDDELDRVGRMILTHVLEDFAHARMILPQSRIPAPLSRRRSSAMAEVDAQGQSEAAPGVPFSEPAVHALDDRHQFER